MSTALKISSKSNAIGTNYYYPIIVTNNDNFYSIHTLLHNVTFIKKLIKTKLLKKLTILNIIIIK